MRGSFAPPSLFDIVILLLEFNSNGLTDRLAARDHDRLQDASELWLKRGEAPMVW